LYRSVDANLYSSEFQLGQLKLAIRSTCNLDLLDKVLARVDRLPAQKDQHINQHLSSSYQLATSSWTHPVDMSKPIPMRRLVKLQLVLHVDR
jgi:hypothetical protein